LAEPGREHLGTFDRLSSAKPVEVMNEYRATKDSSSADSSDDLAAQAGINDIDCDHDSAEVVDTSDTDEVVDTVDGDEDVADIPDTDDIDYDTAGDDGDPGGGSDYA
jgi:hypothetical protein